LLSLVLYLNQGFSTCGPSRGDKKEQEIDEGKLLFVYEKNEKRITTTNTTGKNQS